MRPTVWLLACSLTLAGCATGGGAVPASGGVPVEWEAARSEDRALRDAVTRFWTARSRRDWDQCYAMELPAVRERVPLDFYRRYHNGGWPLQEVRVIEVRPAQREEEAVVVLLTRYQSPKGEIRTTRTLDRWQREHGRWYHRFHDPLVRPRKHGGQKRP